MRSEKERHVIDAAYRVFFRYGYARTTMADLASAAGLSRPALYLVFPGKAEVFQAVVEWLSESLLAAIRESLKDDWPLEKKLLHTLELAIAQPYDAVKANPDAADLLSLNHEVPALEASYASLQNYLADLLSDAVRQSGLKATPADVARTLMSALRGFKLVASDGRDLRRLMTMQVSLIVAALGQSVWGREPAARKRSRAA
jgi:AcrR family transcriptional regulator